MGLCGNRSALVFAAWALCAGCLPSASVKFEEGAFTHSTHAYKVRYQGKDLADVLGPDWRIDNYVFQQPTNSTVSSSAIASARERPGRRSPRQSAGSWVPREGRKYRVHRQFDTTGDGKADVTLRNQQIYDLRLTHRKNDAEVWLSSIPLSSMLADKEPRVLAARYIDATSGAGSVYVRFGEPRGAVRQYEQRWGTRVLAEGACHVSGMPAYEVEFELTNVDRAQAGDAAAGQRVRLVFIDAGFTTPLVVSTEVKRKGTGRRPKIESRTQNVTVQAKTVLLAVHANRPIDYGTTAPAFADFLSQIEFGDATPAAAGAPCGAPMESAGAEQAAPVGASVAPSASSVAPSAPEGGTTPPSDAQGSGDAASAPPEPAPTVTGCQYDTQCKGDRICVNGACTSPE